MHSAHFVRTNQFRAGRQVITKKKIIKSKERKITEIFEILRNRTVVVDRSQNEFDSQKTLSLTVFNEQKNSNGNLILGRISHLPNTDTDTSKNSVYKVNVPHTLITSLPGKLRLQKYHQGINQSFSRYIRKHTNTETRTPH